MRLRSALITIGLALGIGSLWAQAPLRPNVVVIFADDLGYGDLGAFGAPQTRTPRLDAMAAEGQKWTSFYVQPVCSPSRAALLTGRLPVRNGMFGTPGGTAPKVFRDNATQGLPLAEVTVAELLKSAGYRTGMVGKWHLGQLPEFLPMRQGFDSWFGLPYSHDMRLTVARDNGYRTAAYYSPKPEYWDVPLMQDDRVIERPADHRTLTKRYTEQAVRFIAENRKGPFFLYLAHSLPHIPLARSDEFIGHSAGGIYGDVIEEIDWSVGKVLDALRAAGVERNTVVLFTSDNGPWLPFREHGGSAGQLRQGKGSTWEGGVRTPAIFWGPGTVRPRVVTDIGSGLDLLATAASLAGVRVPSDRAIDSMDLTPVLTGKGPSPRQELFYYWDSELRAVRRGKYKAHFITSGAYDDPEPRTVQDPPLLFDLTADPGERFNVAAQHPEVVAELVKAASAHRAGVVASKPLFDEVEQAASPAAASGVTPGEFVVDPPTLINLGFEWLVDGDANRNAKVDVSYRKAGDSAWKNAMPLLRLQGERVTQPNVFALVSPNMFAGSILDLEPDTAYEARFVLTDPDGVIGPAANATKTVTVRTRPEPKPAEGGKVYHVYPVGHTGSKIEPSFTGIMCAYNYYCGAGDTAPGGRPRVKAGDTVLVHAGTYAYRYELYANQTTINATTTFEGTYYLTADGTPEKPIVIKAAGDGEVIIDGRGNFSLFNVKAADYNYFEGITFRNTDIAIWAGTQFIAGSKGLTVKRCRFEQVGMCVFSNYSGSSNFYIADSVFLGRNDSTHLIGWTGPFWEQFNGVEGQQFPPIMKSYTGIRLYGPGHVIAYNYVADFHDGIDTEMYGMPDGSHANEGPNYPPREFWDRRPVSIDIYNNYITNAHDNSIEMDGSMHNIRLMRNVLINSASHPMSTQPSVGGPIYWIRNIVYHAPGGSTRMTAGSPGVLFYNNTVTTETGAASSANSHWRNNLMLGQGTAPAIFSVNTVTDSSTSDFNGFRLNPGATPAFQWNVGPPPAPGATPRPGFATLADYVAATRQDRNSITLDYDIFVNVPKLDRDPKTVQRLYDFKDVDFRLKPGSAAIDRGIVIPNVTDGFAGKAPDLGALEAGQPLPTYGPRR